jgi:hypothetical protein
MGMARSKVFAVAADHVGQFAFFGAVLRAGHGGVEPTCSLARARQAILRLTAGLMVLESITIAPERNVSRMPSLPVTTLSTAAESLTMMMTMSASRAASAGDCGHARARRLSAAVFPGVRL